jgi:hypothetical protein
MATIGSLLFFQSRTQSCFDLCQKAAPHWPSCAREFQDRIAAQARVVLTCGRTGKLGLLLDEMSALGQRTNPLTRERAAREGGGAVARAE